MWAQLREHFVNAQAVIKQIIDNQAWLPLGYETFTEAWAARMGDVTLAKECRPHVVYQMLAEGVPADRVALNTKGVGPESVRELDRQRKNGVPSDYATTRRRNAGLVDDVPDGKSVVSEHLRCKPSAPDTIHLKVGAAILREYHRIAAAAGRSVEDIAKEVLSETFAVLVAAQSSRRTRKAS